MLPKPEIRNPKVERNPKPEQDRERRDFLGFRRFGFPSAFGFRSSGFGQRVSLFGTFLSCSLTSYQILFTFRQ